MFQIVFSPASTAELSALPTLVQLQVLNEFNALTPDFVEQNPDKFSPIKQGNRLLYRYRTTDYRIYFEKNDKGIIIQRVLNKNTLKDFLYRSQLPMSEEEGFEKNPKFWAYIDEANAPK